MNNNQPGDNDMKMNSVSAIKAYLDGDFDGGPTTKKLEMSELKALGADRAEVGKMCADRMTALGSPAEIE